MKISVITDISDISVDILKQNIDVKINKNFEYIKKKNSKKLYKK